MSPKKCSPIACRWCGDMLIHQYHRGAHESSSTFGQWLHRRITADTSFVDIDHQSVDNAHLEDTIHWLHFTPNDAQRLTVLEHKKPGTELSEAQRNILPVWRRLITLGIHDGLISWRSGLFIVEAGPPWTRFDVSAHAEDMHGSPTMVSMPLTERQMVTLAGGPRRGSVFWGRA